MCVEHTHSLVLLTLGIGRLTRIAPHTNSIQPFSRPMFSQDEVQQPSSYVSSDETIHTGKNISNDRDSYINNGTHCLGSFHFLGPHGDTEQM